jgi:hypothetical protein
MLLGYSNLVIIALILYFILNYMGEPSGELTREQLAAADLLEGLEIKLQNTWGEISECKSYGELVDKLQVLEDLLGQGKRVLFDNFPNRNDVPSRAGYVIAEIQQNVFHIKTVLNELNSIDKIEA